MTFDEQIADVRRQRTTNKDGQKLQADYTQICATPSRISLGILLPQHRSRTCPIESAIVSILSTKEMYILGIKLQRLATREVLVFSALIDVQICEEAIVEEGSFE